MSLLKSSRLERESWLLYFNCLLAISGCRCSVSLPHGAFGWSAVCDCGISWSYSLTFLFGSQYSNAAVQVINQEMGTGLIYDYQQQKWIPYVSDPESWYQQLLDVKDGYAEYDIQGPYIFGSG